MTIGTRTARIAAISGLILAMAMPANAMTWRHPGSVVVHGDRGGEVIRYALKAKRLIRSGKTLRIAGRCDSACTIYLSMPRSRICITRGASFGFHKAYGASPRANRVATNYMRRKYPGWVKRWIAANGGLGSGIKTMPYSYAARYLPTCGSGNGAGT